MLADVIIAGSGTIAHLAGFMFAKRGFRTLLIGPRQPNSGRLVFLQKELAASMKSLMPPQSAILHSNLGVEFWSASERHTVPLPKLPYIVIDDHGYSTHLEGLAEATPNFRAFRGRSVAAPLIRGGAVRGVVVDSGETVEARLVVDCGTSVSPLHQSISQWQFPPTRHQLASIHAQSRDVGAAASAWNLNVFSLHIDPGRSLAWRYRFAGNQLQAGGLVPPGASGRADRITDKSFLETGLDRTAISGTYVEQMFWGPPLPVTCADGYLAVGQAAGQGNPLMPPDISASFAGVYLAYTASSHALTEGDTSAEMLWVYPRSYARQWAPSQAFAAVAGSALMAMDTSRLDQLLASGQIDDYAAACLVRNRVIEEAAVDRLTKAIKGLHRLPAVLAWASALRKAARLAAHFTAVPYEWSPEAALAWQQKILAAR